MGEAMTETWNEELNMIGGAMGVKSPDELVSVKRSILDIVVVQQQKRILELEEKLSRTKKEMVDLEKQKERKCKDIAASSPNVKICTTNSTPKLSERKHVELHASVSTPKIPNSTIAKGKSKSAPLRSPVLSMLPRYWTEEEHRKFLEGRKLYGPKNYAAISAVVGTRTPKQVRTHAQKYEMRLVRESAMRNFMDSRQMFQRQPTQTQIDQKPPPAAYLSPPESPPCVVPEATMPNDSFEDAEELDTTTNSFLQDLQESEIPKAHHVLDDLDCCYLGDGFLDEEKVSM
eukprot:CAMPEP_0184741342 /NCGR_PEP_ID=MMETSP0315-20130426/4355_1 /TAXON_ID=101924 /ORGANISM="Rhodosorus marinus, Strain UTEX LB 2760" /LENGTH=287 /DNA_ID=CAMNT_0027211547 /DNA_START=96 /DNA_END=959 /DNA_ORIENTATION=-